MESLQYWQHLRREHVKELEAKLAKLPALEAECDNLRSELKAAKDELAVLKEQAKPKPAKAEKLVKVNQASAPKTPAETVDKAISEATEAYSKPLLEVSPDTLPKRKLRRCKNCGDEFDSRDRLEEFCCTQCRLEARLAGTENA